MFQNAILLANTVCCLFVDYFSPWWTTILLIILINCWVRMELLLATMNDYVSFCDVLVCLCLIFKLIFHLASLLMLFHCQLSHFFFLLTFDHGNMGMSLRRMLYIFRRGYLLPFLPLSSYFVHYFVTNFSPLLCFHSIIRLFHYYLILLSFVRFC